jgi:hypothetical protein
MSRSQLTSTVEQNTGGAVAPFVAGKNKIINGDMSIWQRGTSFTISTGTDIYVADRWRAGAIHSSGTATVSQQSFTPGTAPIAGYESQYFTRLTAGAGGTPSAYLELMQRIENVQTFAGQTVTLSLWAKASTSTTFNPYFNQNFGSGGSSTVTTGLSNYTLTTSWQRFTFTATIPSISGKTVGTGSFLEIDLFGAYVTNSQTIDIWGVQLEAGSVATPFTTASGTLQGELSLCMRYYQRWVDGNGNTGIGTGVVVSASRVNDINFRFIVPMRTYPAFSYTGTIAVYDGFSTNVTSVAASSISALGMYFDANCLNSGLTTGHAAGATVSAGTGNYLEFSAEL